MAIPKTIDAYIAEFSPDVQVILHKIRATIHAAAPKAEEVISYRMPAFKQDGILIYFAAFKNHIGLYPPVTDDEALKREAAPYAGPKGNLQLPLAEPIPYPLIRKIVKARLKANRERAQARGKKK